MFKKHVYTCPDVIHARAVQKKIAYTNLGVVALFYSALWIAGQKYNKPIDIPETPTED